jgi:folate-binding protein YgfZ
MNPAVTQKMIETPLAEKHRAAGARMGVWFGCALPDDFGDWKAEYNFARDSVALIDKNYRAYLSFTGPDRVRYLNALLTNNVRDLKMGEGTISLLLNPQGHILAEIETYTLEDRILGVSYEMIRERLKKTLEEFIIMDDVTLTDETEKYGTLALEGPKAAAIVKELTGENLQALPELGHIEIPRLLGGNAEKAPGAVRMSRRSPGGVPGAEFLAERSQIAEWWKVLELAARKHGGGAMGYTALSARRLEMGVPWFGYDFDERQIPHEAGLQDTHISYIKGCYTGQEIVERVRSRGHVNRARVLLKFSSSEPPAPGTALLADGKEVGHVTRSAYSPSLGCAIAMGYVRRENNAPGSKLHWAAGGAEVIAPPIASHTGNLAAPPS